jgi:hypothetical protein
VNEHEHAGSTWDQYIDLLTSASHWMLEITIILVVDVVIGLLLWPAVKRWIARHDAEHHEGHTTSEHQVDVGERIERIPGHLTEYGKIIPNRPLDPPIRGSEWQHLEARGATCLEPGKRYWVRINEDDTFAVGREAT